MKCNSVARSLLCFVSLVLSQCVHGAAQDFNSDGKTDLLWHYRETGNRQSVIWYMNGETQTGWNYLKDSSGNNLLVTDPKWKIVGVADLNQDGKPDVVWQHQDHADVAVWYLGGAGGNVFQSAAMITPTPADHTWRVVAVADCNLDNKPDLIWQHDGDGQKAVWLINGTALSAAYMLPTGGANWHITAASNMGSDSHPDVLLYDKISGSQAVWYLGGTTGTDLLSGANVTSGGYVVYYPDLDWIPLLSLDLNQDGYPDIIMRHVTLGLNYIMRMSGAAITSEGLFAAVFDTYWAMGPQSVTNSTWRLTYNANANGYAEPFPKVTAVAGPSAGQITLQNLDSIPANNAYAPPIYSDKGITIERSVLAADSWTVIQSDTASSSITDSTPAPGIQYEYRLSRSVTFPPSTTRIRYPYVYIVTGLQLPPVENRGTAIILVDQDKRSEIASELEVFQRDLIADGWNVVTHSVPRHNDNDYSYAVNKNSVITAKNHVRDEFALNPPSAGNPGVKAVILLGHVAVPLSGDYAPDGHTNALDGPEHVGAWPSDGYYGDAAAPTGLWTDSQTFASNTFPWQDNIESDGKFDNDNFPKNIEMYVGRIDFANINIFAKSETQLLKDYLIKVHKYKTKTLPWQQLYLESTYQQVVGYNSVSIPGHPTKAFSENSIIYGTGLKTASALFGADKFVVADAMYQTAKPFLFAFPGGSGWFSAINFNQTIEHSSQHLSNSSLQPRAAFVVIDGSYLGDWNAYSTTWSASGWNNNYLRSVLGIPDYGLVTMFADRSGHGWMFEEMAMGGPIGTAMTRRINLPESHYTFSRVRLTCIGMLGDPTLRLHVISPPTGLVATKAEGKVNFSWTAGESGSSYYLYESSNANGPFQRITVSFTGATQAVLNAPTEGVNYYLVRGVKLQTAAGGSYNNLSLGAFSASVTIP